MWPSQSLTKQDHPIPERYLPRVYDTATTYYLTQPEQNAIVHSLSHRASTELPLTRPSETKTIYYLTQPYRNCTDLHHNIVSRDSTIPIQPRTIYGYTSPVHPRTIHRSTLLNQHDTLHLGSIRYVAIPHQHPALLAYTWPYRYGPLRYSATLYPHKHQQDTAQPSHFNIIHYLTNTVATHSTWIIIIPNNALF